MRRYWRHFAVGETSFHRTIRATREQELEKLPLEKNCIRCIGWFQRLRTRGFGIARFCRSARTRANKQQLEARGWKSVRTLRQGVNVSDDRGDYAIVNFIIYWAGN